jgi:ubiquinone/menaquinone biosynthesis C-methylase UbiE
MSKATLKNDYERMVPEFHKDTLTFAEHMTRYMAAQDLVAGKIALDIACGSGYGTKLLAQSAKKMYGVDVSEESVNYAKDHYPAVNIEYRVGDGTNIPLDDNSVDVVITFETIEHIKDYRKFMKELKRILKHDGLLVVSTPNDLEFAEGNHFHLHEFEYDELVDLIKEDFSNIESYYQGTWKYVAIGDEALMQAKNEVNTPTLSFSPKSPEQYLYFYLLCSNRKITEKVKPIAALGEHYSDRTILGAQGKAQELLKEVQAEKTNLEVEKEQQIRGLQDEIKNIKNSRSYRLARRLSRLRQSLRLSRS